MNKEIYKKLNGKKVLVTGHTGFKGAYLSILLNYFNANVYGFALKEDAGSLFEKANIRSLLNGEMIADIRDFDKLKSFIQATDPDYIIHMAAQPLVLKGYDDPRYTYEVNVMGTVNLFESIRTLDLQNIKSIINVTTDKVYENLDKKDYAFAEEDKLCGHDPYANSKSCSELVTYSYKNSFFKDKNISITTCRAGNVIGGGDVCKDRIIPDIYRSIKENKKLIIRNPYSIRPYQYVIEPLLMYIYIMLMTEENKTLAGNYNIGPDKELCLTTKELAKLFYETYGLDFDSNVDITVGDALYASRKEDASKPHEASFLRLDNTKTKKTFDYKPLVPIDKTMQYTVNIYKEILKKRNPLPMIKDIIKEIMDAIN